MLIELTQRQVGAPGSPVAVNTDLIQRVEPAGDAGCMLYLQGGGRLDVTEPLEEVLDRHDQAHDPEARERQGSERRKARKARDEEKQRLAQESEAARSRQIAQQLQAESERQQLAALGAAERAKRAALAAGAPEREVTRNVTPAGVDLKHPAPQPHQMGGVGTPPVPQPAPEQAAQQPAPEQAAPEGKPKQAEPDRGAGGAFKDKGQQHGQHKGGKSEKV